MATFTGTAANETITPTTVSGTVTRDPLGSLPSNADDTIFGNGGTDTLDGGGGNDTIHGGSGNDTILGGLGNDFIAAGPGADQIDAGAGDDRILVSPEFVSVIGGAGTDEVTIFTNGATTGNTINLATTGIEKITCEYGNDNIDGSGQSVSVTINGGGGDDVLKGSAFNDFIDGYNGNDTLDGGDGNDLITGGEGTDTGSYVSATAGVTVNLGLTTAQNTGGAGMDTLLRLENLTGSNFNDQLIGNSGNNVLSGGAGNDTLDGAGGTDSASYTSATVGVTVNLGLTAAQNTVGAGTDTLLNVENLTGSNFNDTLTGSSGNNVLSGEGGNDRLDGAGGTDTGSYVSATAGVTVNLGLTTAQNTGGAGIDTLLNVENLTGSNFNDTLIGNSDNNVLIGGAGNDQLDGGDGIDSVSYIIGPIAGVTTGVTVNLGLTTAQNTGGAGTDTLLNIENLTGSNLSDSLAGTAGNNVLNGGAGRDTLSYATATAGVNVNLSLTAAQNTVGAGKDKLLNFENLTGSNFSDTLAGNAGENVLDGGAGTDTVSYATATAGVTVNLSLEGGQFTVGAGIDILLSVEHLVGSIFDDILTGNSGNNILSGGGGNDQLDGGGGTDTASYSSATTGVTVNLGLTTAQNTVGAGIDTLVNIENLTGSAFQDTLTGNTGNNVLIGGLGNDILNGAAGIDTVSYETATSGVTVSLLLAGAQNTVGAGTDTLSNFENLKGSNSNDTLTGNAGNNTITGSLGNDTLSGSSGSDSFVFHTALNALTNKDVITDFSVVDDTLTLENAIFTKFTAMGALPAGTFVANAGAVAVDANDFLLYDTTTGKLFYDADGNGAGAKVEFVTLVGIPALTAADFAII